MVKLFKLWIWTLFNHFLFLSPPPSPPHNLSHVLERESQKDPQSLERAFPTFCITLHTALHIDPTTLHKAPITFPIQLHIGVTIFLIRLQHGTIIFSQIKLQTFPIQLQIGVIIFLIKKSQHLPIHLHIISRHLQKYLQQVSKHLQINLQHFSKHAAIHLQILSMHLQKASLKGLHIFPTILQYA